MKLVKLVWLLFWALLFISVPVALIMFDAGQFQMSLAGIAIGAGFTQSLMFYYDL